MPTPDCHQYEVVVIGAGIAGLAAAQQLLSDNISNILILEAENVIGGRMRTVVDKWGGCVELGAQWLHGEEGNPLYPLLNQRGLIGYSYESLRAYCRDNDFTTKSFYTSDGKLVPTELQLKAARVQRQVDEMIMEEFGAQTDQSFEEFKQQAFEKAFTGHFPDGDHRDFNVSFGRYYEKQLSFSEGIDNFDRSTLTIEDNFDSCGSRNFYYHHGTISITQIFDGVSKYVVLDTRVANVDLNDTGVKLTTDSGVVYLAKRCIMTCSLGVLKANVDSMFTPALPDAMRDAIGGMYIGRVEKILIAFDEPFWPEDFDDFSLVDIGLPDDFINRMSSITGDQNEWWRGIVEMHLSSANDRALCVWMNGEDAVNSLQYSDSVIKKVIYLIIQHYTGINITSNSEIFRSAWSTNPHFFGSYSAAVSEFHDQFKKSMLEPVMYSGTPRLWFAGEAYHPTFFSTLHGAYMCGRLQAAALLGKPI